MFDADRLFAFKLFCLVLIINSWRYSTNYPNHSTFHPQFCHLISGGDACHDPAILDTTTSTAEGHAPISSDIFSVQNSNSKHHQHRCFL